MSGGDRGALPAITAVARGEVTLGLEAAELSGFLSRDKRGRRRGISGCHGAEG